MVAELSAFESLIFWSKLARLELLSVIWLAREGQPVQVWANVKILFCSLDDADYSRESRLAQSLHLHGQKLNTESSLAWRQNYQLLSSWSLNGLSWQHVWHIKMFIKMPAIISVSNLKQIEHSARERPVLREMARKGGIWAL